MMAYFIFHDFTWVLGTEMTKLAERQVSKRRFKVLSFIIGKTLSCKPMSSGECEIGRSCKTIKVNIEVIPFGQ